MFLLRKKFLLITVVLTFLTAYASAKTITFEGYGIGTPITNQYSGVVFSAMTSSGGVAPPPIIHAPAWGTTSPRQCLRTKGDIQEYSPEYLIMTFSKMQKNVYFDLGFKTGNPDTTLVYQIRAYDSLGTLFLLQNITLFTGAQPDKVIYPVHLNASSHKIKRVEVEGFYLSGAPGAFELIDNLRYEGDKPLIAQIISPTNLSCVCESVDVKGLAYDLDGLFDYFTLDFAKVPSDGSTPAESDFMTLNVDYTPVNPAGYLGTFDTTGLIEGWYVLRLTVYNLYGESAVAQQQVYVDKDFDTISLTNPTSGLVIGRSACIYGTVYDYCIKEYAVEYRASGSSTWHTIATGNNFIINSMIAVWNTTLVSDGKYELRVSGITSCGNTKSLTVTVIVDNTAPLAVITSPTNCSRVDGIVPVRGTAFDANMGTWVLQYTGGSVHTWETIATGNANVVNGLLANWNTAGLEPCAYTVRLVVYDKAVLDCVSSIHNWTEYSVSLVKTIPGDLTLDGCVDDFDLLEVIGSFGEGCD